MQYDAKQTQDIILEAADPDPIKRARAVTDIAQSDDMKAFRPILLNLCDIRSEPNPNIRENALRIVLQDCQNVQDCPTHYHSLLRDLLTGSEADTMKLLALDCIEVAAENANRQTGMHPTLEQLLISTTMGTQKSSALVVRTSAIDTMLIQIEKMGKDHTYKNTFHLLADETFEGNHHIRKKAINAIYECVTITNDLQSHIPALEKSADVMHESSIYNRHYCLDRVKTLIKDRQPAALFEPLLRKTVSKTATGNFYEPHDNSRIAAAEAMAESVIYGYNSAHYHSDLAALAHPVTGEKDKANRNEILWSLNQIVEHTFDTKPYETLLLDATNPALETEENRALAMSFIGDLAQKKGSVDAFEYVLIRGTNNKTEPNIDVRIEAFKAIRHYLETTTSPDPLKNNPKLEQAISHAALNDPNGHVSHEAQNTLRLYRKILLNGNAPASGNHVQGGASPPLPPPVAPTTFHNVSVNFATAANWDESHGKREAYDAFEAALKNQPPDEKNMISVNGEIDGQPVTVKIPKTKAAIDNILTQTYNHMVTPFPKLKKTGNSTYECESPALTAV